MLHNWNHVMFAFLKFVSKNNGGSNTKSETTRHSKRNNLHFNKVQVDLYI